MTAMTNEFEQDIAISFAGEDLETAETIESKLLERGLTVFFGPSKQAIQSDSLLLKTAQTPDSAEFSL
jgi:hypothetical protein